MPKCPGVPSWRNPTPPRRFARGAPLTIPTPHPMLATALPTEGYASPATGRPVLVQPEGGRHLHAFGDHLHVLLSTASTNGALAVALLTTPAGSGPPPHVHHREAEVFVVLDGEVEFWQHDGDGGTWTRVAPGGAAFLPRGVPHTYRNAGTGPSRQLVITAPGGFDEFFAGCAAVFAASEAVGPGAPPDLGEIVRVSTAHGIEYLVPLGAPPAA
ncbi:hypothetical protein tb265_46210 [Gemmatimonadetes bacterium T265]|nr:hypothetical protein tb265_46210 [Gemmatimonadetes bacterium T265]